MSCLVVSLRLECQHWWVPVKCPLLMDGQLLTTYTGRRIRSSVVRWAVVAHDFDPNWSISGPLPMMLLNYSHLLVFCLPRRLNVSGEDTVQTRAPRLCSCLFTVIKSHFIQQVLLDISWSIFFLHLCDFRSITIILHSLIPESVHFIKHEDASKFKIIIWFYIIHLYCLRKASNIIVGSPNVRIFSVQIFNLSLSV